MTKTYSANDRHSINSADRVAFAMLNTATKFLAKDRDRSAWVIITLGILVLPLVVGDGYYLNVLNFIAIYFMVAVGLCLLVGYCGQLSISHAAFFAIGAYASAILSTRYGLPSFLAVIISQFIAALLAWGVGAVVLRLHGHYLAIATLALSIIVEVLIKEMTFLTGGLDGLSGIPALSILGFEFDSDFRFHYLIWPLAMLSFLFALNLVNSRVGRVMVAIREGAAIASLFGAEVSRIKIRIFILSSVYASLAGSLYAHYISFISPAAGSLMFAIDIIMVIAFGGFTLLWGALLGVTALTYLNEYLTVFADYKRMAYGATLIVIMLFFPNGLLIGLRDLLRKFLHSISRVEN
ncbi:MAG: branched-chain amino acid ABC transporter permease [Arenicellales bacterium]|jgi:branched-chain amino acid transport system permease protein|nr:branched-chain amino acid ABC transporter permease [Arenicellales bacterium]|tara:strand:+ start:2343 stop:3395 length:1053 start_codon:yes stop_codon:yes gene_type:complete